MNLAGIVVLFILLFPPCSIGQSRDSIPHHVDGKASYYAKKFQGRKTANGEQFNNTDYTAAHRTLPFNTYLNVINESNNFNVIVRVNDRGPFSKNRVIDLSEAAARRIGGYHQGVVRVRIEVLDLIEPTPQLDSIFNASPFVDCLGNISEPSGITLSLWSSSDLLHAVYVANDLYLKEKVNKVYIGHKHHGGNTKYHVLVSGISSKAEAARLKDEYERKGFMKVFVYEL